MHRQAYGLDGENDFKIKFSSKNYF